MKAVVQISDSIFGMVRLYRSKQLSPIDEGLQHLVRGQNQKISLPKVINLSFTKEAWALKRWRQSSVFDVQEFIGMSLDEMPTSGVFHAVARPI